MDLLVRFTGALRIRDGEKETDMNLKKMFAAQDMIVGPPWKRIKFLCRNSFCSSVILLLLWRRITK